MSQVPPGRGVLAPSRPIGPFVLYGVVLVAVGVLLAVLTWASDTDEVSVWLWFRWSSTVGVLLDLLTTTAVLRRSVGALESLWVLTGVRFVSVVLGISTFGWDDGRADPTYVLVLVLAGVTALASVVLTLAARRRLRYPVAARR